MKKLLRACIQVGGEKVWVSAHTKKQLEQKKTQVRQNLRDGVSIRKDIPFYQLIENYWLNEKKPRLTNPNTLRSYDSAYRNHLMPAINKKQMSRAVTRQDVQHIIDQQAGQHSTVITICVSILRSACRAAVSDKLISSDPTYGIIYPKAKGTVCRDALTPEQTNRCLSVAAESGRFGLCIYLLYYLGIRKGELFGLKWKDIDFQEKMVHIDRQIIFDENEKPILAPTKSKKGNRYIPMPSQLADILKPYKMMPECHVMSHEDGMLMNYGSFYFHWQKLMEKANTPTITPHWFRHNYITMLYDAGIPSQIATRLAGHESYITTLNIYTHIKNDRLKRESIKLDSVFSQTFAQPLQQTK